MKEKNKIKIIAVEIILIIFLSTFFFLNTYPFFFLIISDSMNPAIYKNDIVFIKKDNKNLEDYINSIIAFYDPTQSKIIVHRVLDSQGRYLLTKGDNSNWIDFYRVSDDRIIGEVFYILKTSKIFK